MKHAVKLGIRMALTFWQRRQLIATHQVEVLEVDQLPEAFGQQTGEQLVRKLFRERNESSSQVGNQDGTHSRAGTPGSGIRTF